MFQVVLKGGFETENPDILIEAIDKVVKELDVERFGQFAIYQLNPYIDYQRADVTDPQD